MLEAGNIENMQGSGFQAAGLRNYVTSNQNTGYFFGKVVYKTILSAGVGSTFAPQQPAGVQALSHSSLELYLLVLNSSDTLRISHLDNAEVGT